MHRSLKKRLSPIFFNLRPSSVLPPTPTRPSPLQPGWAAGLLHSHAKPLASGSVPFLGKDWRSHSPLCTGDQSIGLRRWWCPRLSRSGHRDLPERRERRRGRGGVTLTDASGDSAGAPPLRADKRPSASLFLRARHASRVRPCCVSSSISNLWDFSRHVPAGGQGRFIGDNFITTFSSSTC